MGVLRALFDTEGDMRRKCPRAWAAGAEFAIGILSDIETGEIDADEAGLPGFPRSEEGIEPWMEALSNALDNDALIADLYARGTLENRWDTLAFSQSCQRTLREQLRGRLY